MDGDHRPNRKKHAADESLESLHRVDPHVIGALEAASLHHPAHSSSRRIEALHTALAARRARDQCLGLGDTTEVEQVA